ncbi:MAG TPA: hypothetical protein VNF04_01065 [Stellaceae bacterium]|nr:hypothetical protein [Stellaceae bacterium]
MIRKSPSSRQQLTPSVHLRPGDNAGKCSAAAESEKIGGQAPLVRGSIGGNVSDSTNVISFPPIVRARRADDGTPAGRPADHEFTERELAALCRWFSAMKYAFPGTEGVMIVSHRERYSAVGLYNPAGGAPNCLVAKHQVSGAVRFFWSTEGDPPRIICDLSEITDAHIRAIRPPRNEKGWLDPIGWMGVYAARMIATALQVV